MLRHNFSVSNIIISSSGIKLAMSVSNVVLNCLGINSVSQMWLSFTYLLTYLLEPSVQDIVSNLALIYLGINSVWALLVVSNA